VQLAAGVLLPSFVTQLQLLTGSWREMTKQPLVGKLWHKGAVAPGKVHLWRVELDCAATSATALRAMLSLEEKQRAARFRSLELCERWTVARGALRCILATYAGCEPSGLVFRAGPHGKLALAWPAEDIPFNLSHTGGLALVAIAGSGRVGVDAETVQPEIEVEELSRRFFSPAEAAEILSLCNDARLSAFFTCWTRKEAFAKAIGSGLSVPLSCFQVSVRSDQSARLLWVDGEEPDRWSLLDVSEPGVAAALVVEGPTPVMQRMNFVPSS
jgi:4'-phosphopantetheinyl transferase